jgi:hypothetical protein
MRADAIVDPYQVLTDLMWALIGAGIDATIDPRDLNPPAVLVELESISHNLLSGGVTTRVRLFCVVPDVGTGEALRMAAALMMRVLAVVEPNTELDSTYEAISTPDGTGPLPAILLRVDVNE